MAGGAGARRALSGWVRTYHLAPRYPRDADVEMVAADGVRLHGVRIAGPSDATATIVVVHGFAGWSRHPRVHAFAHALAAGADVLVPDLRGHGRSRGRCTFGCDEHLDVAAAVAAADPARPVVTVGSSLGAAAVIAHAAISGGVAAVVAVSAPAWFGLRHGGTGARRVGRYVAGPVGRAALAGLVRTRVAVSPQQAPDPVELVAEVAPAATLLVHDPDDHYFDHRHAEALLDAAGEPKTLWWRPGEGHGTDLFTPALAADLVAALPALAAGRVPPA